MILADFSNLTHRMVFAAIANGERNRDLPTLKKGEKHDMQKVKPFFLHLLFNNFKYVKETFSINDDEDMILCLDSSSWRKDFYPLYKSQRSGARDETTINWSEFYKIVNETVETIKEYFPFKVVKVDKAEGDDVMAVIAKHYHTSERVLLITEDKDFKQLLEYPNVQLYRPILKQYIRLTPEELIEWRVEHILLGDKSDGIPTIKDESEFTVEFINYLKENGVDTQNHLVHNFNKLSNGKELMDAYTGVDKYGKVNIFKAAGFGEKGAQQFVEKGLLQNLKKNKVWRDNFKRNRILVQFKYIPEIIENNILEEFKLVNKTQIGYNSNKVLEFFNDNSLRQLASNVEVFCPDVKENVASLDDWF